MITIEFKMDPKTMEQQLVLKDAGTGCITVPINHVKKLRKRLKKVTAKVRKYSK